MTRSFFSKKSSRLFSGANLTLALWALGVSLLLILVMHCMLATPIADVWYYYNKFTDSSGHGGIINYVHESLHHTGRVLQWAIVYVGFALFKMHAVKSVPVILLICLFGALFWLFKQLKIFHGQQENVRIAGLSLLISAASIVMLPSFFDSLLWLDAAAVYLAGLVMLVLNLNFLYLLLFKKPSLAAKIGMLFIMAIGQTLSEPMSALMIGLTMLGAIAMLIIKDKKRAATLFVAFLSLVAGFALLYFSPGSTGRRQAAMPGFDANWVFVESFNGFAQMIYEWKWWLMLLPIIMVITMLFVNIKKVKLKARHTLMVALAMFAATTYPVFVMNNYSQDYVPDRVMTLPVFGVIAASVVLGVFFAQVAKRFIKRHQSAFIMACMSWMIIIMPFAAFISARNMEKISLREKFVITREQQVNAQIQDGARPIRIMTAPNLLRSNAEDFTYDDGPYSKGGRGWVANSYLKYKGLDERLPKEAIDLMNPPEFYR